MVYLFLADGFEIVEAMAPYDMLTRAGIPVTTVGVGTKMPASSSGVKVQADCTDENFVLPEDAQMVVLPGGMPGTNHLRRSPVVKAALEQVCQRELYAAAICAAPWVLDEAGLLDGKKATMYPTMHQHMKHGTYTGQPVEVDGKIITGRAAGCAVLFGLELVRQLAGAEAADKVKEMIYPNW